MVLSIGALVTHFVAVGFTTTVLKILITHATPLLAFGLRNTAAGALLIICSVLFSKKTVNLLKHALRLTLLGSLFRVFIPSTLSYWALQYVSAPKFAFFYNLGPFITYILSYLILNEAMTRRKLTGIVIAFLGTIPILFVKTTAVESQLSEIFAVSLPELAIFVAIFSLCLGSVLLRRLVIDCSQYSIFAITGHDSLIGGGLALLLIPFLPFHQELMHPYQFVKWATIMTIVTGFMIRPMYAWLLKRFSATLLSVGSLAVPFTTAFFSWMYFGDVIGAEFFYSTALILVGCYLFYGEERRINGAQKAVNLPNGANLS